VLLLSSEVEASARDLETQRVAVEL